MATIGTALVNPESGWARYDGLDPKISYVGTTFLWTLENESAWAGLYSYRRVSEASTFSFSFRGTKLRFIGVRASDGCSSVLVNIDGVIYGPFSQVGSIIWRCFQFEVLNLPNTEHSVIIYPTVGYGHNIYYDAIDIDESGQLLGLPVLLNDYDLGHQLGFKLGLSKPESPNTSYSSATKTVTTDFKNGFLIGFLESLRSPLPSYLYIGSFVVVLNRHDDNASRVIMGVLPGTGNEIVATANTRHYGYLIINGEFPDYSYEYGIGGGVRSGSNKLRVVEGKLRLNVSSTTYSPYLYNEQYDQVGLTLNVTNNTPYPLEINVINDPVDNPRFILGNTIGDVRLM